MAGEPILWIRRGLKLISDSVAAGRTVARSRVCLARTYSSAELELPADGASDSEVASHPRQRLLRVAIIGAPNAGKSTLVNGLVGRKVFAVSPKVHTTQRSTLGVFTEGDAQVVLTDTPGVVPYYYGRRIGMSKMCLTGAQRSVYGVDMIVVMVDCHNKWTRQRLDPGIVHILKEHSSLPSVLVLNKVDLVKHKHTLLSITLALTEGRTYVPELKCCSPSDSNSVKATTAFATTSPLDVGGIETVGASAAPGISDNGHSQLPVEAQPDKCGEARTVWDGFREVYMMSALTGDGIDGLRNYLLSCAVPRPWEYNVESSSDQSDEWTVEDVIREKLCLYLDKEIPYVIKQETVQWERSEDGSLFVLKNLTCKKNTQVSIVIGPGGSTIHRITDEAEEDLEKILGHPVRLKLFVRSKKK